MQALNKINDSLDNEKKSVKLTRTSVDIHKIDRTEIETDVIEAVKVGNVDFLGIVLETGYEKKILQIEKEVYDLYLKVKIYNLENRLLIYQKIKLSEYIDGEQKSDLKDILYELLKRLIDTHVEDAIQEETELTANLQEKFKVLKIEVRPYNKAKAHYLNHFSQHDIFIPVEKISKTLDDIRTKMSIYADLTQRFEYELSNLMQSLSDNQLKYENMQDAIKTHFIYLVTMPNRIPLSYQYDYTEKQAISKFLSFKVSPNLIDPATGDTLLHIAIDNGRIAVVEALINRGADPLIKNRGDLSAVEKASLSNNPRFSNVLSEYLSKTSLLDRYLKEIEDSQIKEILKPLGEVQEILNNYNTLLLQRKNLCLFLRMFLHYEKRLESRTQDCEEYYQKFNTALNDLDPHVFFNEVEKRAAKADRGLLGRSQLHDALMAFRSKYMQVFDAHTYNELKKTYDLTKKNKASENEASKYIIKKQGEQLANLEREVKMLKDKFITLEDTPQPSDKKASPKQRFF